MESVWHNHSNASDPVLSVIGSIAFAQSAPEHGKRVRRLLIHNAMVVDGNGTPASGPKDILIEII